MWKETCRVISWNFELTSATSYKISVDLLKLTRKYKWGYISGENLNTEGINEQLRKNKITKNFTQFDNSDLCTSKQSEDFLLSLQNFVRKRIINLHNRLYIKVSIYQQLQVPIRRVILRWDLYQKDLT
jgi:hypothetical protein